MNDDLKNNKINAESLVKDHLANERTYLAWVRTSIGIMAFGFVIEKFALFLKQMTLILRNEQPQVLSSFSSSLQGHSSTFGILLVAFGALLCLLAFIKYTKIKRQIEDHTYQSSNLLNVVLTFLVVITGIVLVIYLGSGI